MSEDPNPFIETFKQRLADSTEGFLDKAGASLENLLQQFCVTYRQCKYFKIPPCMERARYYTLTVNNKDFLTLCLSVRYYTNETRQIVIEGSLGRYHRYSDVRDLECLSEGLLYIMARPFVLAKFHSLIQDITPTFEPTPNPNAKRYWTVINGKEVEL